MNYPVWQLDFLGGGLLIAAIAIFHVYIAHFAVGGGLFLVLAELKGHREENPAILNFVRCHTRFFLLVTMVAGGITGVGIWFTIALLNPAATSLLIHTFVFGWAAEWVFFLIEIVALLLYYYTFGKLDKRLHLTMGWIYFGAAWMSLFIINGIIDFMLTPGGWLETGNFWAGFFNPTFLPALAFRTFFALLIAGLFGLVTATWIKEATLRRSMIRFAASWLVIPFALFLFSAFWYKAALPPEVQEIIFTRMPSMQIYLNGFLWISAFLMAGGLLLLLFAKGFPQTLSKAMTCLMLCIGLMYMGCFEFIREGGRKPFIIHNYMYSNSIIPNKMERINQQGVLSQAKWIKHKSITKENKLEVGRALFNVLCLSCHSIDGPLHNIKDVTEDFTPAGLDALISGMHHHHPYMPPYPGTAEERAALAYFIGYGLHGQNDTTDTGSDITEKRLWIPEFDIDQDEYLLLAWPTKGMHLVGDSYSYFSIEPPGNSIRAQLILRGETPEVITEDVVLRYRMEPGFSTPAAHTDFWDMSKQLFTHPLPPNTGITGTAMQGVMQPEDNSFFIDQLPVLPYTAGRFDPYPVMTIVAEDADGRQLAETKVAVPVSTEMGCSKCHGGQWRVQGKAGMTTATARNILTVHDRMSGTDLMHDAELGNIKQCRSCHGPGSDEKHNQLSLSAALHGFHAPFLQHRGAEGCAFCHASGGATQSMRGVHHGLGMDCTNCHGTLEEHALSLLKGESQEKTQAQLYSTYIQAGSAINHEEIKPRIPWEQQPDCLNCHEDFEQPETDTTFNSWTTGSDERFSNSTDESGSLFCAACHATAHSLYPGANAYGERVHNIQPLQYQQNTLPIGSNFNCAVCHTIAMEEEMHHPNMLREFRN